MTREGFSCDVCGARDLTYVQVAEHGAAHGMARHLRQFHGRLVPTESLAVMTAIHDDVHAAAQMAALFNGEGGGA